MAIKRWLVAAALAVAGLSLGQLPANAAPAYASDHFKLCIDGWDCRTVYLEGWIYWGNRTARMTVDHQGATMTGHFDAFAGSRKIDSRVTIADTEYFSIGDPDLVGGINRIRSQACISGDGGAFKCSDQWNDIRD